MRTCPLFVLATISCAASAAAFAAADLRNSDPSAWTGPEVYQILNNSPWAKTLKVDVPGGASDSFGNQNAGNTNSNAGTMPPGGTGRRGMGAGAMGGSRTRTYSSGGNNGNSAKTSAPSGPAEVTVQWQSALAVRLAAAKRAGDPADPAAFKPLDEYVIATIGLPITAVGGPAAGADTNNTLTADEEQRLEDHVKNSASLLRSGHQPLTPVKIELDQGKDGRMLLHFPKSDPIKPSDKNVEFRLVMVHSEIRKKFPLKEMEYRGKLDL